MLYYPPAPPFIFLQDDPAQLIAVAATVKRRGYERLRARAKDLKIIQAPGFRRPPSNIKQRFVKVLGKFLFYT